MAFFSGVLVQKKCKWSTWPDLQSLPVAITILAWKLFCFARFLKVGTDGQTDGWTKARAKIVITIGHAWGSASWINMIWCKLFDTIAHNSDFHMSNFNNIWLTIKLRYVHWNGQYCIKLLVVYFYENELILVKYCPDKDKQIENPYITCIFWHITYESL